MPYYEFPPPWFKRGPARPSDGRPIYGCNQPGCEKYLFDKRPKAAKDYRERSLQAHIDEHHLGMTTTDCCTDAGWKIRKYSDKAHKAEVRAICRQRRIAARAIIRDAKNESTKYKPESEEVPLPAPIDASMIHPVWTVMPASEIPPADSSPLSLEPFSPSPGRGEETPIKKTENGAFNTWPESPALSVSAFQGIPTPVKIDNEPYVVYDNSDVVVIKEEEERTDDEDEDEKEEKEELDIMQTGHDEVQADQCSEQTEVDIKPASNHKTTLFTVLSAIDVDVRLTDFDYEVFRGDHSQELKALGKLAFPLHDRTIPIWKSDGSNAEAARNMVKYLMESRNYLIAKVTK